MGIGVEAEITDRDLALVGDRGSRPGDELQVVHPLHLLGPFPIPITNASFLFIEGEALQGQERTNHVFSHSLGQFVTQQLLADKIGQDLPAEDLSQPRVVDPRYLMEEVAQGLAPWLQRVNRS